MTHAPATPTLHAPRPIEVVVPGTPTSDGAGVKLTRLLDHRLQRRLDPFLMLDAFGSDRPDDYIAGFPDHPHRGFETITYMIAGRMRHQDSAGNAGLLENGGVQWMTAGRGVIHSEIPQQEEGRMEGFQLWLNLPASDKMCAPWYRDFTAAELPRLQTPEGVGVCVIAGHSQGVAGAVVRPRTEPLYLDLSLPDGATFEQPLPAGHNALLHVYRGQLAVGSQTLTSGTMAVLANATQYDGVRVQAQGATRALLIAGQPLNEPIVQYGPFVMNSEAEIQAAIEDFRRGRLVA